MIEDFPEEKLSEPQEAGLSGSKDYEKLVLHNMRSAVNYAGRCCGGELQEGDLISICYDVLLQAAPAFRPSVGLRFIGFCKPRLRGAVKRHFNKQRIVKNGSCVALVDSPLHEVEHDLGHCGHETNYVPPVRAPKDTDQQPEFDAIFLRDEWARMSKLIAERCDDRERTILIWVYQHGYTFEKLGDMLDISRQAVQSIAAKCLKRLSRAARKIQ
jgi:RNA polymerase sigma factor (sigma-70 family)